MKVFGIIMETNPLHNGHSYFIKKIKEIYQPDVYKTQINYYLIKLF